MYFPTAEIERDHTDQIERSTQIYKREMKYGFIDLGIDKIVMFGIAGSGKTCSLHALLGKPPPPVRCSTPLMERPISVMMVKVDDELQWQEMTTEQSRKNIATIIKSRATEQTSEVTQSNPSSDYTTQQQSGTTESEPQTLHKLEDSLLESGDTKVVTRTPKPMSMFDKTLHSLVESFPKEYIPLVNTSDLSSKPIRKQNWLYVIDSGGQPEFHEVLPIFLEGASDFIYVFKVNESLHDQPKIVFHNDIGEPVSEPCFSFQTNEEILKQCIRTIHSFTSKNKDREPPHVLLLGTHRDLVEEEKLPGVLESLKKRLRDILEQHFSNHLIYCDKSMNDFIFTINATEPDKKYVDNIRKTLNEKDKRRHVKMPLRWYALDQIMRQMAQKLKEKEKKDVHVFSKDQCLKIASALHIDDKSCEKALEFFNDLNLLFYWPSILPNLVFLEPQLILRKVSELVKRSHEMRSESSFQHSTLTKSDSQQPTRGDPELTMFKKYRQVTEKMLESFDTEYEPPLFTHKELMKLFEGLLIVAKLSNDAWFMPSLLEVVLEGEVQKYRLSLNTALIIHFPDGGPQDGMFCCMVAFVLSHNDTGRHPWELSMKNNQPICLKRNVIQFNAPNLPGSITMIDYFTHFEVHVQTCDEKGKDERKLWQLVYRSVFNGLKKASKILGYEDNTYEHAIACKYHPERFHIAIVNGGWWICSEDKSKGAGMNSSETPWWSDSMKGDMKHLLASLWHDFMHYPFLHSGMSL